MRKFIWTPFFCFFAICMMSTVSADIKVESKTDPTHPQESPLQYGSFYTKCNALVAPEHAIPFDHATVTPTSGVVHIEDSGDFIIKHPGIYRVTYSVSLKEDCGNVALTLDNHVLPGSEMYVGEHDQLSTLSFLVKICGQSCCDHVLRLINNYPVSSGWYTHDITLDAGPDNKNVSASILIERVNQCPGRCGCDKQ